MRRAKVWVGRLLPVVVLALSARGQGGATAINEKPIELPKFEVVDSRDLPKPESWRYAALPGFEILSNLSSHATKRFADDFLLLQEVIDVIMPVLNRGHAGVPTALVLCGGGNGFNEFLPLERKEDEFSTNSLFFENSERTAIVVDFALAELQLQDDTRIEADPYRSFYREYFRYLIRRQISNRPAPWLEEGLVQLFAAVDFTNKWINFGLVGDGFGGTKPGDFNELLARRAIMPLDQMFASDPRNADPLWAAQCYAFVHMCLYGENKKYQKPFIEFVSRSSREPITEAMFRDCFHASFKAMALELRGYLQFTMHTYVEFKAKKGQKLPEPPPIALRDATQAEVGRIKGEVLRLGGHDNEAHLALIAPYIRGERTPALLAALGLDEATAGHDERAQKFLEVAAREHVVRPRAYFELARLRFNAARHGVADEAKLDSRQLESVLAPLSVARSQPPPLPEVYELMAEAWSHASVAPSKEQLAIIAEGVRLFPRQADLLKRTILLAANAGFRPEAEALAVRGTEVFAADPTRRDEFALLALAMKRDEAATKK